MSEQAASVEAADGGLLCTHGGAGPLGRHPDSSGGIRVLVADHVPTRLGIRLALAGHAEICAEADTCPLAVSAACTSRPDVCLIGESLPGGGINAVREISRAVPETSLVVLSHRQSGHNLLTAVRAGAVGYVPAGFDAPQLRRVITSVVSDQVAVPRSLVRDLVTELRELQRAVEEGITGREAEILAMLRAGRTTTAIATQLEISPVTVRRHISKLVQKAGVRDRDELIRSPNGPAAQRNESR